MQTDNNININLKVNQAQESAIHHGAGPMLVLAGPGSGKTFVVTHRIKALIEEHHADPARILVITFTKAAATEMKERFGRLSPKFYPVQFGTFHAFFYHILKQSYYPATISILSEREKREYIKTVLRQEPYCSKQYGGDMAEVFLAELGRMKNQGCPIARYEPVLCEKPVFEVLYGQFERRKAVEGKIDFDDMLHHCYWLLQKNPQILAKWQGMFDYLMIDEYQDINEIQYRIVRMLAGQHHNLFAVGDDDQSIYSFRGAKPDMMRRMTEDYPDCRQILLSVNYRSRKGITDAAGKVIGRNKERIAKSITAANPDAGSVRLLSFADSAAEEAFLIKELTGKKEAGTLSENAVIFRTNRAMADFAGKLVQADIPFYMKEKAASVFQHPIAQDLLAYLEFAAGNHGRGLFYRFMNRPYRGIARNLIMGREVDVEELLSRCVKQNESRFLCGNLQRLSMDLRRIADMQPYAALQYIRKGMGYEEYLIKRSQGMSGGEEKEEDTKELLHYLQESTRRMRSLSEWKAFIDRYEDSLEKGRKEEETDREALHLMTMHGAKGLEYGCVYLPRLNEGVMPHKKSTGAASIEEECRMLYVGMTRAKEELCMSYLAGTREKPEHMSRFLEVLK